MSIKNFIDELRKGLKSPAYLLYAEDPYLLKEALFAIKQTIPEDRVDFLLSVFDMDSPEAPPAEQVLDVLYTVPFFGGRKTVVIENAQKLLKKDLEALARYLAEPSPDSVLVMTSSGKLKKSLKEGLKGAKAIPMDIRERELPAWLKQRAAARGLTLTPQAVEYLMGTVGPEAGLLASEVEKLAMSGKERLDAQDIKDIVKGSGGHDVFDLIDALKARDADRVFRIYRALSEAQDPYGLLGALNWHYERASAGWKSREKVFHILNEADLMMKSSGGAYPVEYLLVKLLRL
ncbi:MAG: DNA polymerase III subunit delta [Nitrospirota bacterium]|jgi:DNA polymerase III delta subunit